MPIITPLTLESANIDYLIVGGGTAGLTLAARLSEDPDNVVLVVEAGISHGSTPEIDVPGFMGRTIANPKFDWTFLSVPQVRAHNRVVLQPRGKGLGGSSHNNFLGMFRPSKEEMDALEELGNEGWNWESLLYYMKKSETTLPSTLSDSEAIKYAAKPDPAYHGTTGPIKKSFPTFWTDIHAKILDTAEALGIPRNPETSNGRNIGAMSSFSSVDSSTALRSHSASAYLEPNLQRANLLILTDAQVTKVILEEENVVQRATGVEYVSNGVVSRIEGINKEVILAAGTFQTPQLLELSGIGNRDILAKHGIKTVINLPGVGENLQDHVGVSTIVEIESKDDTMDVLSDPVLLKKHEELYKEKRGLLSSVAAPAFVFLSGDALGTKDDLLSWKEHAHTKATESLANAIPSLKSGLEKQYKLQQKFLADKEQAQAEILNYIGHQPVPYSIPEAGKRYSSLFCALMHPFSRGTVHLVSSDPLVPPAIDPNYFANEADLDMVVNVVQFALKMYATSPLSDHVKAQVIPSQEIISKGRLGLKEYIKENCGPVFHPVGTAAMLPRSDGGVVDAHLKVYGTSNLRIVDLSILPLELSCHTQSIAYSIGEKAADILKAEVSG